MNRTAICAAIFAATSCLIGSAAADQSVYWQGESPQVIELDDGMAIDLLLPYTVSEDVDGPLRLAICEHAEGETPYCWTELLDRKAQAGDYSIRYGFDSSQYVLGTNYYTLTLLLGRGGQAGHDSLQIIVEVSE